MARKGSQKVKTGCLTCKARKVKCDETKPHCERCTSTSRKCDGYDPPQVGVYSWLELLGKKPILPVIASRRNTQESRALEFYHRVIAPSFTLFPEDDFWTKMVAQASYSEPAVRHAVIAISCIYEQIGETPCDLLLAPKGRYAMGHYNQALQQLTKTRDESVVLFVCVLFVCIEALRENKDAAIAHCRHGIMIYNSARSGGGAAWVREYLLPTFVRLSAFPFFFGGTLETIPGLSGAEEEDISGAHNSFNVSRYRIDLLIARCIRFVRSCDPPAPGLPKPAPDVIALQQRERLDDMLDEWLRNFETFKLENLKSDSVGLYLLLQMKCLSGKIWISACTEDSEMAFDQNLPLFRQIVEMARLVVASEMKQRKPGESSKHKFIFEMGYLPTLYFVVIKCRDLETRISALAYLTALSADYENLWNASLLYSVGKRVIELEHGTMFELRSLDGSAIPPPEELRVRDAIITRDAEVRSKKGGRSVRHRRVNFMVRDDNRLALIDEWVEVHSLDNLPTPRGFCSKLRTKVGLPVGIRISP
ncbi:hypothetical protein B0H67DRAFT_228933 [Lasiosphaeris hirsuta]|uniref:Zn(2)-C6 fungal-type domain-containing protein n=1 Tax=Lasiosphaeris hirsuta TaxID=260670 RepID=A0AA40AFK5_9PEZI|nr:hypothetical protein B0H67DRAFT_228933 [Lasiosphaeris hirsuta]